MKKLLFFVLLNVCAVSHVFVMEKKEVQEEQQHQLEALSKEELELAKKCFLLETVDLSEVLTQNIRLMLEVKKLNVHVSKLLTQFILGTYQGDPLHLYEQKAIQKEMDDLIVTLNKNGVTFSRQAQNWVYSYLDQINKPVLKD